MKLTEWLSEKTHIENMAQTVRTAQYANSSEVSRRLQSLVPGQTIQGEIVGKNGNEVLIRLLEDMVISARIDQSIHLEPGKSMTFEVKNNGLTLMLSPLFTNVAADVNVLKALDMAGLPVNNTSVSMTEQMMKAGLPVNRAALQQVYREINAFPDGEIADVVNLHKLQMPVNQANMGQMESYRNLTYRLTSAMDTVLELMPQAVEGMIEEGDFRAAANVYRELFSAMREGEKLPYSVMSSDDTGVRDISAEGIISRKDTLADSVGQKTVTSDIAEQFLRTLDKLDMDTETGQAYAGQIRAFAAGEADVTELFEMAEKWLQTAETSGRGMAAIHELFGQKGLKEIVVSQLKNLWTIRPEEVQEPEKVSELYRRIDRQLNSLSKALEMGGQTESGAYRAVSAMSQNIDFLQQLNQMYAYVQLPLQLQQGRAHGDLYVYANRKGFASTDGQVSALLHLDMEQLGPLDIYVTLHNSKVNTKFYVQDDEMLDFLSEHMDLLTERLKKRGYTCDFSMTSRGEEKDQGQDKGLSPILKQDGGILLSQYAFDVRT